MSNDDVDIEDIEEEIAEYEEYVTEREQFYRNGRILERQVKDPHEITRNILHHLLDELFELSVEKLKHASKGQHAIFINKYLQLRKKVFHIPASKICTVEFKIKFEKELQEITQFLQLI